MSASTVFVCTPYPLMVEGLRRVLAETEDLTFVGSAASLAESLPLIAALQPAVALVDQTSSLRTTLQEISTLREAAPDAAIVLWNVDSTETDSVRALQFGARGVIRKGLSVDRLVACLRAVAGGELWLEHPIPHAVLTTVPRPNGPKLTVREREVMECVRNGLTNREISAALGITPGTVKVHLMHLFEKAGVADRVELAVFASQLREQGREARGASATAE